MVLSAPSAWARSACCTAVRRWSLEVICERGREGQRVRSGGAGGWRTGTHHTGVDKGKVDCAALAVADFILRERRGRDEARAERCGVVDRVEEGEVHCCTVMRQRVRLHGDESGRGRVSERELLSNEEAVPQLALSLSQESLLRRSSRKALHCEQLTPAPP